MATALLAVTAASAQIVAPAVQLEPLPPDKDVFNLNLDEIRRYSASLGFEVLGHDYLKVPERTDWAKAIGRPGPVLGSGFNTVRVHEGIAYLAGYTFPTTLFGILIVDVRDPGNMKPLGFVPCMVGTRCTYLRINTEKKILIFGNDPDRGNPRQPPAGQPVVSGWQFYDVSNPAKPRQLAFVPSSPDGATHGMEIDDRYLYGCGTFQNGMTREGLQIIDYADPRNPKQVATWHVTGMLPGEKRPPMDDVGVDGKPQILQCHEIVYDNDRLYIAWRDSGFLVMDIKDRSAPKLLGSYDHVPPYHGGGLGAAHTALPVVVRPGELPNLMITTDEIFDCPSGFGRILDISDFQNPQVVAGSRAPNIQLLSTFRAPHVQDKFDFTRNDFVCPTTVSGPTGGVSTTSHLPVMDLRSPSLLYVTWYDEGLRVFDISNPYIPTQVGYYMPPPFAAPNSRMGPNRQDFVGRFAREIYQDPATNLIYLTDGGGGGLTVLRYTGPIPKTPPIPGAR
jgi:hypothetical protein